jgi:hypothetical protein
VWGARENSGKDNFALLDVMHDLRDAKFTVPGYDLVNQRPADGVSDTSLLINLYVDETILKGYAAEKARRELARRKRDVFTEHRGGEVTAAQRDRDLAAFERELATIKRVDRAAFGKQLGGKGRGTPA